MPKKGQSEEQIVAVLRQLEAGARMEEMCRKVGISPATYYLWKRKYSGVGVSELRELRQLREEAGRLKRLYREEELIVRTKQRRKMARRRLVATDGMAAGANHRWSMDFVSDKLADGRSFRILTVVDQFTRECVCLEADRSMTEWEPCLTMIW